MPTRLRGTMLRPAEAGFPRSARTSAAAKALFVVGDERRAGALTHATGEARVRGQQRERRHQAPLASPVGSVKPQPAWRIVSAGSQCSGPTKTIGRPAAIAP